MTAFADRFAVKFRLTAARALPSAEDAAPEGHMAGSADTRDTRHVVPNVSAT